MVKSFHSMWIRKIAYLFLAGMLALHCTKDKQAAIGASNRVVLGPTAQVTSITSNSAVSGGNIQSVGVDEVIERGVCWSTAVKPTIDGTGSNKTVNGKGVGLFTSNLVNLAEGTTYYVRSYAKTQSETIYGSELSFTTIRCPTVTTQPASNIQGVTAIANGNLTSLGSQTLVERGFCFNTATNPTVNNSKVIVPGATTGSYAAVLQTLMPNTPYFVRSYAITSGCTIYGNEVTFTTMATPVVSTSLVDANSITINSAVGGGQVTNNGGAAIRERGICWNLTGNPTTTDARIFDNLNLLTPFSLPMNGLLFGRTYYVRAYAINQLNQTGYGQNVSFNTRNIVPPNVSVNGATNITTNSVTLNGTVNSDGGGTVSERGFFFTASSGFPNTPAIASTSGLGPYSVTISGLLPNTLYQYVAYARNQSNLSPIAPSYSVVSSFTTLPIALPTVTTTNPATNITSIAATLCGNVTSAGGGTITERGVCWNTTGNPTYLNPSQTFSAAVGSYCVNATNLLPSTTYYFRAFARNQANPTGNPSYGAQVTFRTADLSAPTLVSPASGNTVRGSSVNFSWSAVSGATSYEIQISRSNTFSAGQNPSNTFGCGQSVNPSPTLVNARDVSSTTFCLQMTSSALNSVWFWRVRAKNGSIIGPWSGTNSFNFQL